MEIADIDFSGLMQRLKGNPERILILSHRNPDGDAIGSSVGLAVSLAKLGHTVNILIPNSIPKFLKWMKKGNEITIYNHNKKRADDLLLNATIVFALDFNDLSRVREFEEKLKENKTCYKVLIDHHPHPGSFADITISDTKVSSTAELVYEFLHQVSLNHLIDTEAASCLYAGIMTDTGCFSYNSSRPETFQTISNLLSKGIDKNEIFDLIYDNFSIDRMRLMGYCLDKKMVFLPEYKTAYISLTQEELRKYNFKVGDSEGFVNLPLSISDVRFSALIIENKDCVKLSFRSKGSFPVNILAADHFNGGGHTNAAGGESSDAMAETVEKFVNLLPNYKDGLHAE